MSKYDLAEWMRELHLSLINCDPSLSEDALYSFFQIEEEQEALAAAVAKAGYTMEDIEDLLL